MSLDSPMTGRVLFSVDVTVMTILLGSVFVVIACLLFIIRLYIVVRNGQNRKPGNKGRITLLIVAGSGGHTAEILRLMKSLSSAYSPRIYVIADTDRMSEERIRAFEKSKLLDCDPQFTIHRITRSREVHQSWISSVRSTLNAQFYSIPLIFRIRPDMVLCNGPGTCIPLCIAGLLLGTLGIKKVLIVFIESICRVESLSLTGRILYHFSDYFFVQWANLRHRYPKSIFLGRIV
ncbi:UDP-N-acetylglucosamine transferase subunit ALG14 homolog isoform X2 [Syngnathoides biaculeatus]|uniref:UDP-N-acetylglucosamine transferase subunit ALG14 homolog isoform X2 n=1 Tax=Syngnathoides biaculeatus TaxID=300417 RepID=UPI002ADD6BB1|nr:UDP-N-acetylglucosamine transferase subunit ALG14 homolog isoform X2 [Syngnathoides biaculeatus]